MGPDGSDEWIQIGLSAFPGSESRMYYEVKQPRTDAKYVELRSQIAPGERHRVAVLEVHGRPDVWRVWVDGAPASGPVLPAGQPRRVAAAGHGRELERRLVGV